MGALKKNQLIQEDNERPPIDLPPFEATEDCGEE